MVIRENQFVNLQLSFAYSSALYFCPAPPSLSGSDSVSIFS